MSALMPNLSPQSDQLTPLKAQVSVNSLNAKELTLCFLARSLAFDFGP